MNSGKGIPVLSEQGRTRFSRSEPRNGVKALEHLRYRLMGPLFLNLPLFPFKAMLRK